MPTTPHESALDKITTALSFNELKPDEQEELLVHISSLIFRSSMLRFIEHMDDATRDEFVSLIDKDPSHEKLHAFITTHIPTADQIVEEVLAEITDDILSVTQA